MTPQPGCGTCAHLHENRLSCTAFPNGIPLMIQSGQFDHRQEWTGDGGVRYEPAADLLEEHQPPSA